MKVTNVFQQIKTEKTQVKRSESGSPTSSASKAPQGDRVELSAGSQEVQKAKEVLAQTPAVRADRVQELKQQIERGEYQVDPHKIADKMMASLLSETVLDK